METQISAISWGSVACVTNHSLNLLKCFGRRIFGSAALTKEALPPEDELLPPPAPYNLIVQQLPQILDEDRTPHTFNVKNGYGFIAPESGGKDIYIHITELEKTGIRHIHE